MPCINAFIFKLPIFTIQIFASMFSNSTQRLAAVTTSFSPLKSQRQPIVNIHFGVLSFAVWLAWLFIIRTTKLDEFTLNWYWMRAFPVKIYAAARACFSLHSGISLKKLNLQEGCNKSVWNHIITYLSDTTLRFPACVIYFVINLSTHVQLHYTKHLAKLDMMCVFNLLFAFYTSQTRS